jgi:pimeloyl-ACP methyl ester carboxylesterase
MAVSEVLGQRRTVEVPAGTIEYRDTGAANGSGPPIVFVHGVGVNGDLWRGVVPRLAGDRRCIAPDLPWGAHSHPLRDDTDMSLPGLGRILADFIEALGFEDVTIVANDTGGAVTQWTVGHHAERIGRLVLTSCDAFDKYPPTPQLYLKLAGRVQPLMWLVGWSVQFKVVQRLPTAYGWTTKKPIDEAIMRSYTDPIRQNPGVRRDLARLLRAVDNRDMYEAAEALGGFDKPTLLVWAADDKLFPVDYGRRLAEHFPQARFETMPDSRTFVPEEQPERLAARVREFLVEQTAGEAVS